MKFDFADLLADPQSINFDHLDELSVFAIYNVD